MLNPTLQTYCQTLANEFGQIDQSRQGTLRQLAHFLTQKESRGEVAHLVYICTHNSRRSQMGQAWAQVAGAYYGVGSTIRTYSGGTEATAFNPAAVQALERAGFAVSGDRQLSNPMYQLHYGPEQEPLTLFSKVYDEKPNPQSGFCAVMVCSQADEACPFVPGAEKRISLPYADPKQYDGTSRQAAEYDNTCRLIALETFRVFDYAFRQSQSP